MQDIVRILQDIAEGRGLEYHYGKKAALNILDGTLDADKIYMLHEYTNRKSEYNQTGTGITAVTYEGKFFLVKHSNLDAPIFNENGNVSQSKYVLNIEPLLETFKAIGNDLACDSIAVTQWDCIDITDALDANFDGLLISYRMRIESTYVPATGGGEEPGACDGIENFTGFTTSPGVGIQTLLTFNGGNLKGETYVYGFGGAPLVLPQGINVLQIALGAAVYTINWQRRCGGEFIGPENSQEYEVINSGTNTKRLTMKEPFNENGVQFPVNVAIVVPNGFTFDTVTDSGITAVDENEFITIWNSLNGVLGTISNPVYRAFPDPPPGFYYWEYTITMNDYQLQPTAMWCFPATP